MKNQLIGLSQIHHLENLGIDEVCTLQKKSPRNGRSSP